MEQVRIAVDDQAAAAVTWQIGQHRPQLRWKDHRVGATVVDQGADDFIGMAVAGVDKPGDGLRTQERLVGNHEEDAVAGGACGKSQPDRTAFPRFGLSIIYHLYRKRLGEQAGLRPGDHDNGCGKECIGKGGEHMFQERCFGKGQQQLVAPHAAR